jgi:hypothetical protein
MPNVLDLVPVGIQSIDYLKPEHIPEHFWTKIVKEQDPLDARSCAWRSDLFYKGMGRIESPNLYDGGDDDDDDVETTLIWYWLKYIQVTVQY